MNWLKPNKQQDDTLKKYKQLREDTGKLHQKIAGFLTPQKIIEQAAKALGLLHDKTIVMEDENDMGYIMDFSIFEVKIGTQTAIQYFYDYGPELSAKEDQYLADLLENHISFFEIIGTNKANHTADLKDILNDGKIYTITDVALSSQTQQTGILIFTRILTFGDMSMTAGTTMAFNPVDVSEITKRLGLHQFTKRRKLNRVELYLFFYKIFRSIGIETRTKENY